MGILAGAGSLYYASSNAHVSQDRPDLKFTYMNTDTGYKLEGANILEKKVTAVRFPAADLTSS